MFASRRAGPGGTRPSPGRAEKKKGELAIMSNNAYGAIRALQAEAGQLKWEFRKDRSWKSPAATDQKHPLAARSDLNQAREPRNGCPPNHRSAPTSSEGQTQRIQVVPTGFEPTPKDEASKTPGLARPRPLLHEVLHIPLARPFRHRTRIAADWVCALDPTSATARVSPSPIIEPVPASIPAQFGNNLGTVLATSAPCGQNSKTPRGRRASLGFADFKHHRNLFPM
jgi:hypothetical protein